MLGLFIAIVCGGLFFTALLLAFRRVDKVLREVYDTDRKLWLDLGKPTGFFWRPKERVLFFGSVAARNDVFLSALFGVEALRRDVSYHSSRGR